MYNLNTKRAIVEEGGVREWVSGSFWLPHLLPVPHDHPEGQGLRMEFTGITFAGPGQNLDTGAKVVHTGADTSSYINTKSISKDGGISTFRSAVVINKDAKNSKAAVSCQSLCWIPSPVRTRSPQWTCAPLMLTWATKPALAASVMTPCSTCGAAASPKRKPAHDRERLCG